MKTALAAEAKTDGIRDGDKYGMPLGAGRQRRAKDIASRRGYNLIMKRSMKAYGVSELLQASPSEG